MLGFLEVLCGSRASELNVRDKEKYKFDPKKLLSQIASIVLRVWTQECRQTEAVPPGEGFLVCFSTHPEFSQATVDRWCSVLTRHNLLDPQGQKEYSQFLEEVCGHSGVHTTADYTTADYVIFDCCVWCVVCEGGEVQE